MATTEISTVILPLAPSGDFRNEPFVDFKASASEHAMKAALERVGAMLGHEYELVIGGERLRTKEKIRSVNPARPAQVVGIHQQASAEHAEQAIAAALKAFETWQFVSPEQRTSSAVACRLHHSRSQIRILRLAHLRGRQELG